MESLLVQAAHTLRAFYVIFVFFVVLASCFYPAIRQLERHSTHFQVPGESVVGFEMPESCRLIHQASQSRSRFMQLSAKIKKSSYSSSSSGELEDLLAEITENVGGSKNFSTIGPVSDSDNLVFPELEEAGIDEKALRASPFGKLLFSVLDTFFPVFTEPNWFDVYDPPLSPEANLDLPYFDGYDFVNSSWTIYVRHRFGAWNWLDRLGLVPQATQRVFLRQDGKSMWSDGFYGQWYINPAINYFQLEKHFGRGYGYSQYHRGLRIYQVQRWNFEHNIGRYWQRGLRSYLRNETNFFALEGRVWGAAAKWRPYPRDQGKFIAIRSVPTLAYLNSTQIIL